MRDLIQIVGVTGLRVVVAAGDGACAHNESSEDANTAGRWATGVQRVAVEHAGDWSGMTDRAVRGRCRSEVALNTSAVRLPVGDRLHGVTAPVVHRGWRFDHIGIPTSDRFAGEIPLPHLGIVVSDQQDNPVGVQWQRYEPDADYPDLVKTVAHVAFEVDDLARALEGQRILIEPNSPSAGVTVAFIEVRGAPVELLQINHARRPDLS